MFNQPHINEMMARETIDYRVRDAETLHRGRALRHQRPQPKRTNRRVSFARIRQSIRRPA